MNNLQLKYKEETGFDVGVYCPDFETEQTIMYYDEYYVEWLEQKIKLLTQNEVILPFNCCWGGNNNNFGGVCSVCGGFNQNNGI
jgi:hypothetical protein